jgi:Na+-translocating ferredoxin:NAD+ oxidoreductase RnfG subunit
MLKKLLLLFSILSLMAFTYPKKMARKIDKEIKTSLNLSEFNLEEIKVNPDMGLPLIIKAESFFKVQFEDTLRGYLYYGQAKGKAANFDYIVIFDKDLIIAKIKILVYREGYGGEIGSYRWLKQFTGLNIKSSVVYKKDIAGISGATISANALTQSVNKLLKSISILKQKHIL